MLSALPHNNKRVFPYTYKMITESFQKLRKQVAAIIAKIQFKTDEFKITSATTLEDILKIADG
jgi:hypothetical protein